MVQRQLLWLAPQKTTFHPGWHNLRVWHSCRLYLEQNPLHRKLTLFSPRVGLLDLSGSDMTDAPFLKSWLDFLHPTQWVGILDEPPIPGTRSASFISNYCVDYYTLPINSDHLCSYLGHLWDMAKLRGRIAEISFFKTSPEMLDGSSEAIVACRTLLQRYALTLEPVLIRGATGTGKESAARFTHHCSYVSEGPFVVVNCAALPESLTQSELFGHEKGAFTGAEAQRPGRIEAANGGTLLLDGIDELSPKQQSILLRFLEKGEIEPVGSVKPRPVNVRIISTTSEKLEAMIRKGSFRADLFYRLSVLQASLPLLTERTEDLPGLVKSVQASISRENFISSSKTLSSRAMDCLCAHLWPGNIRELQNRLRRAALMSDSSVIEPHDLGLQETDGGSPDISRLTLKHFRAQAEKRAVICSLTVSNYNVSAAARRLNISRLSLYRLMEKYDLARSRQ